MSDPVVIAPHAIPVPGLRIAYQFQVGDGQAIAFEAGVDQAFSLGELNELFDRLGAAVERRKAKFDLPLCKEGLVKAEKLLPKLRKDLADAMARSQARNVVRSDRRLPREVQVSPPDMNAIGQAQSAVQKCEEAIEHYKLRIPYLEAIIDGRDPPEPVADELMEMPILAAAE